MRSLLLSTLFLIISIVAVQENPISVLLDTKNRVVYVKKSDDSINYELLADVLNSRKGLGVHQIEVNEYDQLLNQQYTVLGKYKSRLSDSRKITISIVNKR